MKQKKSKPMPKSPMDDMMSGKEKSKPKGKKPMMPKENKEKKSAKGYY